MSRLSGRQQQAINLLVSGCTAVATARALGVSRGTVARWKNRDQQFIAELDRRQREVWESASNRLRTMSMRAMSLMEAGMNVDDQSARIRNAFRFLGRLFTLASPKPDAVTEMDVIDDAIRMQRRAAGTDPAAPIGPADRSAMLKHMVAIAQQEDEAPEDEEDWERI